MATKSGTKKREGVEDSMPRAIKFKYKFDSNYNPVFIDGAFGGITPSKHLSINFYFERHPVPYSETLEITQKGTLGKIIEKEPEEECPVFIRYITNGIILDLSGAKIIHKWLGEQINNLEKAIENDAK